MTNESPSRILVDLKPALDGHSGIPNETRLLFELLSQVPAYRITGLIQHGGRKLRSAVAHQDRGRPESVQIDRVSRAVVSLYEDEMSKFPVRIPKRWRNFMQFTAFHSGAALGMPCHTSAFISTYFKDFLWGLLFDKSLGSESREHVLHQQFELLAEPRAWFQRSVVMSRRGASAAAVFPKVDTSRHDIFIAQTPFPGRVSDGTKLVIRYHDAVPVFWPHTIADMASHQSSHFLALRQNVRDGAYFACTSEATRSDLVKIFPEAEPRTAVIHNHPSTVIRSSNVGREAAIRFLLSLKGQNTGIPSSDAGPGFPYLLMVSTFEPRKNHVRLLSAWLQVKLTERPDLKLVLVGGVGWSSEALQKQLKPHLAAGDVIHLQDVPSSMLSVLYTHATATVCPSLAEGFDYSGVEAMRCECPVIASDIPVHREIYGDACLYFDPYSADDLARQLLFVTGPEAANYRAAIQPVGLARAALYTESHSTASWLDFLDKVATGDPKGREAAAKSARND